MKEIIATTEIPRERGYLYVCGTDEETGCLTIIKVKAGRKKKVEKE